MAMRALVAIIIIASSAHPHRQHCRLSVSQCITEVNISSYPGMRIPGLFLNSHAEMFKYWSGTIMRNTVMLLVLLVRFVQKYY